MSQSLSKALHLLKCLGPYPDGLGVRELGRVSGLKPSTVHGLLKALQHQGFVAYEPTQRCYCLGLAIATLGAVVDRLERLRTASLPALESLFAKLGETTTVLGWIDDRG